MDAHKFRETKENNEFKSVLQKHLREVAAQLIGSDQTKSNKVDFPKFKESIMLKVKVPFSQKEKTDELCRRIFDQYDKNNTGYVPYREFIESIRSYNYDVENLEAELGPETLPLVKPKERPPKKERVKQKIRLDDFQNAPESKLEQIHTRTLKIERIIQGKYSNKEEFEKDLHEKLKIQKHGNVYQKELENFFVELLYDNLKKREIARRDIEGFLSSFTFNVYRTMNVKEIPVAVYE